MTGKRRFAPRSGQSDESPLATGDREIVLSMAGETCRLVFQHASDPFFDNVLTRYGPWCLPASPVIEDRFTLRVKLVSPPPPSDVPRDPLDRPLTVEESGTHVAASRWDFHVKLLPRPQVDVRMRTRWIGEAVCERNQYSFDALLRVLWSTLLPRLGGMLIHACAVRVGSSGILLPGPSGAGKSTFASKMPDSRDVLTDELAAVMTRPSGGWRVFSTPFWGDFRQGGGGGSLRSRPLRGLAFLEQGPSLALNQISPAQALARLLECFLYFSGDQQSAARNLQLALELISGVPSLIAQTARETPPADVFLALQAHWGDFQQPDEEASAREMISEFRWMLSEHGRYAYRARGYSMKPWIRDGEIIYVVHPSKSPMKPGQVVVYWTPGATENDDRITCHRLVLQRKAGPNHGYVYAKGDNITGIAKFENGLHAEVLGTLADADGARTSLAFGSRARDLARLALSLGTQPIMKLLGR